MKSRWWISLCLGSALLLPAGGALAQDREQERDKDKHDKDKHDKDKHDRDDRDSRDRYDDRDRDNVRRYYGEREHGHGRGHGLPPGLAKRDRLPPGLERQLVERGELPPGLRGKIRPCPEELVRELPPPPRDYEHVLIGGHVVLLNRKTFFVLSVIHVEIP